MRRTDPGSPARAGSLPVIDHAAFGALRLSTFLPRVRVVPPSPEDGGAGRRFRGDRIVEVERWEFDDRVWIGEVIGFTEVLQLPRAPHTTRSVAVELTGRHARVGAAILEAIGLPLRHGQGRRSISRRLGRPAGVTSFGAGRETLAYEVGRGDRAYLVRCTVDKKLGVTYVVVQRA